MQGRKGKGFGKQDGKKRIGEKDGNRDWRKGQECGLERRKGKRLERRTGKELERRKRKGLEIRTGKGVGEKVHE